MPLFTKGAPLALGALPMEKYPLPELGKDVFALVRGMTAGEGQVLQAAAKPADKVTSADKAALAKFGMTPDDPLNDFRFISWVLVNEDGTPVFVDTKDETGKIVKTAEQDARENFNVSLASLQGILELAMKISGLKVDREKN